MTNNDFLDAMRNALVDGVLPQGSELDWLNTDMFRRVHDLTFNYDSLVANLTDSSKLRWEYIREFGFSIPCAEAMEVLRRYAPILEVGAGTGFWSGVMRAAGIDVICTNPKYTDYSFSVGSHCPTENLKAEEAQQKYPDRTLFCSWPCYQSKWLDRAALRLRPGQHLIYVGEGPHGCTGGPGTHKIFRRFFTAVETVCLPQFTGIHDEMIVYRRV